MPGPLCHGVITKDGHIHLVGYGRTNHAGGDPRVLARVTAEDYGTRPPAPTKGNVDGTDGNRHFYGFECENAGDGRDPWLSIQLTGIEQASVALCRAHGWTTKSVIGHLEWSDNKVDPGGFTMPDLRERIAGLLAPRALRRQSRRHPVVDRPISSGLRCPLARDLPPEPPHHRPPHGRPAPHPPERLIALSEAGKRPPAPSARPPSVWRMFCPRSRPRRESRQRCSRCCRGGCGRRTMGRSPNMRKIARGAARSRGYPACRRIAPGAALSWDL
ncbi:peptidoglycan recognition protein family protein [Streptomyces cremeus]|uniref:N-acetylmuramoyl-L-alanine amidase n=1 Tax=Streptomyces cremeus TaxID=66881 RepID=A0ABV5PLF5_STRCM